MIYVLQIVNSCERFTNSSKQTFFRSNDLLILLNDLLICPYESFISSSDEVIRPNKEIFIKFGLSTPPYVENLMHFENVYALQTEGWVFESQQT